MIILPPKKITIILLILKPLHEGIRGFRKVAAPTRVLTGIICLWIQQLVIYLLQSITRCHVNNRWRTTAHSLLILINVWNQHLTSRILVPDTWRLSLGHNSRQIRLFISQDFAHHCDDRLYAMSSPLACCAVTVIKFILPRIEILCRSFRGLHKRNTFSSYIISIACWRTRL